jgi:hypothetical protein
MKITKKILVLLSFVSIISCENYLDVNTSPNNPTLEVISPELILAGAQNQSYKTIALSANQLGNVYQNNWTGDINNFAGPFSQELGLTIDDTFYDEIWNNIYRRIYNFQIIDNNQDESYNNYRAISKIMKSFYFQYLVDLYGDIPYSEALQGADNITPVYDDAETVYGGLLSEIDAAVTLIENSSSALDPGSSDIIFNGDMDKWTRFANTLKLRILLRQKLTGTYNSMFASLNGVDFLEEDVTIQAEFINETDKQSPYFEFFGFDIADNPSQTNNVIVAANYGIEFLKGLTTENNVSTGVFDPRVEKLYTLNANGAYSGVEQGQATSASTSNSKIGDGLLIDSSQDGYVFTAAESRFLQSEAVLEGLITSGTSAEDHFKAGVQNSFDLLGANIGSYITDSDNTELIGWNSSSSKLEVIMTQKWIALNGINGIESFIEFNRTGFPQIPIPANAIGTSKPYRLLYPSTEKTGNSGNVPSQTANTAFDSKIFWDLN